jgi:hypothetical protein
MNSNTPHRWQIFALDGEERRWREGEKGNYVHRAFFMRKIRKNLF